MRELLYQRACERDAEAYAATPLTAEGSAGWLDQHGTPDEPATDVIMVPGPYSDPILPNMA